MPGLAGDALAVLVGLDNKDFRMVRQALRRVWMDMQLAEPGAERLMLFDRKLLVSKEDDEIFHQCPMDFAELPVVKLLREIDAKNLSADRGSDFAYFDSFVNHFRLQIGLDGSGNDGGARAGRRHV